ncbi:MAG: tellurite resistance TerB family protein [Pseudomonadota bacterium]
MIDPNKILNELAKSGIGGGMAGGLISGALAGALTGGGKGGGNKLMKLGSLAAVGTLAYKAYQTDQTNSAAGGLPAAGTPGAFGGAAAAGGLGGAWGAQASQPALGESEAMTLLRAMIAAAKADGQIDAQETQAITAQLGKSGLSAEDKAFLFEELARPLNLEAVLAGVKSPQQAAQVYAASRLVVADASPAEQAYLGLLAARLSLDPAMTRELDQAVKALPG